MKIKMTVDLGEYKSGFCIFDAETGNLLHHGCLITPHLAKTCRDLFCIASAHGVKELIVEQSHRIDSTFVKMDRLIEKLEEQYDISINRCTAAEWRQSLHFYVKQNKRMAKRQMGQKYKTIALSFVEKTLPEEYKEEMSNDEAEAICMVFAYMKGIKTHKTNKEKRNLQAIQKKQFHKREQEDEYYDEPIESRKLYL